MKRLLLLIVLVLAGCGDRELEKAATKQNLIREIIHEVNTSGTINDAQAASLSEVDFLVLPGLISITDPQAEFLGKVKRVLELNGLTSISDKQAEMLSQVEMLSLDGLLTITDDQAEILSKIRWLSLTGLTSITDRQARSLSKVENLEISEDLQPLIDKYKKQ